MKTAALLVVFAATVIPPVLVHRIRRELRDAWWFGGALNTTWLFAGLAAVERLWPGPATEVTGDWSVDSDGSLVFVWLGPLVVLASVVATTVVVWCISVARRHDRSDAD